MVEEAISFWTEIQRFEDMLVADPRSLSFAPLSELYRKLGLLDDAISVAKKGCGLHPEYPGGFYALGCACLDKGLKDEARRALERVVELNTEHVPAQKLLGQLYVELGEIRLARRALEQVLEQNPDDTECELLLLSLTPSAGSAVDQEEVLEELEVIEDLTEEFEEPQATAEPQPSGAFTEAIVPEPAEDFTEVADIYGFPDADEVPANFEVSEAAKVPEAAKVHEVPEDFEVLEILEVLEEPASPVSPETAAQASRDPLKTATLAELYVSQGFLDKALTIYQELLTADPGNQAHRERCAELKDALQRQLQTTPAAQPQAPIEPQPPREAAPALEPRSADAELSRWLENIRRRRDGV